MNSIIDTVNDLAKQAREIWEDEACQERVEVAKVRLKTFVREHPTGAISLAVVAGYLLGKITQKRN